MRQQSSTRSGAQEDSGLSYSAHQVPNALHSGLWAFRGAARLVRPAKKTKNVSLGEPPASYFDLFTGVLKLTQKKEVSDFLVIGYLYLEINCNFIYVTSFCSIQLKLSSVNGIG